MRRKTNKVNFSQQVSWMMCISAIGFFRRTRPELKNKCQKINKKVEAIVKRPVTKDDVKWICNELKWFLDYIEDKRGKSSHI